LVEHQSEDGWWVFLFGFEACCFRLAARGFLFAGETATFLVNWFGVVIAALVLNLSVLDEFRSGAC
jgi:hypothetical protein